MHWKHLFRSYQTRKLDSQESNSCLYFHLVSVCNFKISIIGRDEIRSIQALSKRYPTAMTIYTTTTMLLVLMIAGMFSHCIYFKHGRIWRLICSCWEDMLTKKLVKHILLNGLRTWILHDSDMKKTQKSPSRYPDTKKKRKIRKIRILNCILIRPEAFLYWKSRASMGQRRSNVSTLKWLLSVYITVH